MTTFDRSATWTAPEGFLSEAHGVHHISPNFLYLPPVVFYHTVPGQRDALQQAVWTTIANADTGTLQTYVYDRWANVATYAPTPTAGDTLTYDPQTGTWVPTPTTRPVVESLRVFGSSATSLVVKPTYALLTKTGTGSGTMTLSGDHTLTGGTDASYRIEIDSTGTASWDTATFKWSADGGTTYTGTNVPVASGATSGRKTLQPILLQDGVYVLFSNGTYDAADNWTFTLLAANNQDSFLQYDSTLATPILRLSGATIANLNLREAATANTLDLFVTDSNASLSFDDGKLDYTVATGLLTYEGTNGAGGRTDYFVVVPGVAADRRVHFPVSLSHTEISTPATPGANIGKLYAKDGGGSVTDPYWLDASGVERNLATGQHPLNTGDPHTQYPLAASGETITAAWLWAYTATPTSGDQYGITSVITINPSGASTATGMGLYGQVTTTGATANTGDLYGLRGFATHLAATATAGTIYGVRTVTSTGNVLAGSAAGVITAINGAEFVARANNTTTGTMATNLRGIQARGEFNFANAGGTTVTNMYGGEIEFKLAVAAGTVTTGRGLRVHADNTSAGVLTTGTMLEVAAWPSGPTYTNGPFGMSVFGATSLNWAEGAMEIGALAAATRPTSIPAQLTVSQPTIGNPVIAVRSVATNDDPTLRVEQARVATTDATVTTLQTITIPATTTVMVIGFVTARRTGGAGGTAEDGAGYVITGTFKNVAGTATQIGVTTNLNVQESQVLWDAAFDVNAGTARIRVTGAATNNVTWHSSSLIMPVGS